MTTLADARNWCRICDMPRRVCPCPEWEDEHALVVAPAQEPFVCCHWNADPNSFPDPRQAALDMLDLCLNTSCGTVGKPRSLGSWVDPVYDPPSLTIVMAQRELEMQE